tara:strand:+ start:1332 stop:2468 length:1137 start_codon:yes stop_codon:yes gene_type:complete
MELPSLHRLRVCERCAPIKARLGDAGLDTTECVICSTPLGRNRDGTKWTGDGTAWVSVCSNSHVYHKECIQEWKENKERERLSPRCPECRQPLLDVGFGPISPPGSAPSEPGSPRSPETPRVMRGTYAQWYREAFLLGRFRTHPLVTVAILEWWNRYDLWERPIFDSLRDRVKDEWLHSQYSTRVTSWETLKETIEFFIEDVYIFVGDYNDGDDYNDGTEFREYVNRAVRRVWARIEEKMDASSDYAACVAWLAEKTGPDATDVVAEWMVGQRNQIDLRTWLLEGGLHRAAVEFYTADWYNPATNPAGPHEGSSRATSMQRPLDIYHWLQARSREIAIAEPWRQQPRRTPRPPRSDAEVLRRHRRAYPTRYEPPYASV